MLLLVKTLSAPTEVELLAPSSSAEELTEDVFEVATASKSLLVTHSPLLLLLSFSLLVLAHAFRSNLVVNAPFFFIAQHIVGIRYFLELFLCALRVLGVLVRVVLDGLLLECFLYFRVGRVFLDAHYFIVVSRLFFFLLSLSLLLLALCCRHLTERNEQ